MGYGKLYIFVLLCFLPAFASAEKGQSDFFPEKKFISPFDGTQRPFSLYVPSTYRADKKSPLMVFLHGWGGDRKLLFLFTDLLEKHGVIGVAPQTRERGAVNWADTENGHRGAAAISNDIRDIYFIIHRLQKQYSISSKKIYCQGFSGGAHAVWFLLATHPDFWAGGLCSAGLPLRFAKDYFPNTGPQTRIICFLGEKDSVNPPSFTKKAKSFLEKHGGNVFINIVTNAGHNLLLDKYDKAFNDVLLWENPTLPRNKFKYLIPYGFEEETIHFIRILKVSKGETLPTIEVNRNGNNVNINSEGVEKISVLLTGDMVNRAEKIKIRWNNKTTHSAKTDITPINPQNPYLPYKGKFSFEIKLSQNIKDRM